MKTLEKIVEKLIINGSLTEQPGLFYGKTGIAVFFFHYARHTGNDLFQDYAMYLIEMVQKQIANTSIPRYDIGLAGIGVGFEYLLQNDFLEVDDNDFFEDFDALMCRATLHEQYPDLNMHGGLTGFGRYFIYRLNGNYKKDKELHEALTNIAGKIIHQVAEDSVPENEQPDVFRFLYDLTKLNRYTEKYSNVLHQCRKWKCINEPDTKKIFPYLSNLQRLYTCQKYFNIHLADEITQEWKIWEETGHDSAVNPGLLYGWTSDALLHLTYLNKNNISWINLI